MGQAVRRGWSMLSAKLRLNLRCRSGQAYFVLKISISKKSIYMNITYSTSCFSNLIMERLFSDPPANSPEPSRLLNIDASYRKIQDLLRTKDDTSRFVGLAILKTVLDNGQLAQDPGSVRILWEALSTKFLDRLLRAHQSAKLGKSEARDMVDIAVAVLHTFSILLPEDSRKQARLVGRTSALVGALVER